MSEADDIAVPLLDKRVRARQFQQRLAEALDRSGLSRGRLAERIGVDRSTISQLLNGAEPRLPNGHVVGSLAAALKVSADWLLGLTMRPDTASDILEASMQIRDAPRAPSDEHLIEWHREAAGSKIRNVPLTLPELMKTEAVLQFEYRIGDQKTSDQAILDMRDRLALSREPESDLEICMPMGAAESFALGQGYWHGVGKAERIEQLERMAELAAELYPSLRIYLFDLRAVYSAPVTIFGAHRAVIYVGQSYFVFNAVSQIRALTRHFDDLVRAATVQADEASTFFEALLPAVRQEAAMRRASG